MELAVVAALAATGLLVVLLALRGDAELDAPGPALPDWDPLPTRADLAQTDFGLRVPGYDPATVEAAFDTLADAYADLLAEADPPTIARARRRAAARLQAVEHDDPAPSDGWDDLAPAPAEPSVIDPPAAERADPTVEALRAEVALDALRRDDANR